MMGTSIDMDKTNRDTPIDTTKDHEMTEIDIKEIPEPSPTNPQVQNVELVCLEVSNC